MPSDPLNRNPDLNTERGDSWAGLPPDRLPFAPWPSPPADTDSDTDAAGAPVPPYDDLLAAPADAVLPGQPSLERDLQDLAWLAGSAQLGGTVSGYVFDALAQWAVNGRGLPQMQAPQPAGEHLAALLAVADRLEQRVWLTDRHYRLDLAMLCLRLRRAARAASDPDGVHQDVVDEAQARFGEVPWSPPGSPTPPGRSDGRSEPAERTRDGEGRW